MAGLLPAHTCLFPTGPLTQAPGQLSPAQPCGPLTPIPQGSEWTPWPAGPGQWHPSALQPGPHPSTYTATHCYPPSLAHIHRWPAPPPPRDPHPTTHHLSDHGTPGALEETGGAAHIRTDICLRTPQMAPAAGRASGARLSGSGKEAGSLGLSKGCLPRGPGAAQGPRCCRCRRHAPWLNWFIVWASLAMCKAEQTLEGSGSSAGQAVTLGAGFKVNTGGGGRAQTHAPQRSPPADPSRGYCSLWFPRRL